MHVHDKRILEQTDLLAETIKLQKHEKKKVLQKILMQSDNYEKK